MKIELYYEALTGARSPLTCAAKAIAEVRVTPKMIICISGEITWRASQNTFPHFSGMRWMGVDRKTGKAIKRPLSWRRKDGRPTGTFLLSRDWRISAEEMERIRVENPGG